MGRRPRFSFFNEKVFQYADLLTDNRRTLDQLIPKDPIAEELGARLRRALQPAPAPSRPQQPFLKLPVNPLTQHFHPDTMLIQGSRGSPSLPNQDFPASTGLLSPAPWWFPTLPATGAPVSASPTFSRLEPPRPKPHARLPIRPNVAPHQETWFRPLNTLIQVFLIKGLLPWPSECLLRLPSWKLMRHPNPMFQGNGLSSPGNWMIVWCRKSSPALPTLRLRCPNLTPEKRRQWAAVPRFFCQITPIRGLRNHGNLFETNGRSHSNL